MVFKKEKEENEKKRRRKRRGRKKCIKDRKKSLYSFIFSKNRIASFIGILRLVTSPSLRSAFPKILMRATKIPVIPDFRYSDFLPKG